jgi:uncharacterized peroxidase-related enzyme
MPFFPSMADAAGPPSIFKKYPEIYRAWSELSEALMNGPSPLDRGQRELILSYSAGLAGCTFVCAAHAEVAYALGVPNGLIDELLENFDASPIEESFRALLIFVSKSATSPASIVQADVDAVFAAGWNEKALHDAIAITARAAFMQRLVHGYGFTPLSREVAAKHARQRVRLGYLNLYSQFRGEGR